MQFTKLRLAGFKSFVDRTDLPILPGLTGIVGPNGCGKSNLVEALRWVMGENSAKRMRGSGMDDVIFNGTVKRPQRNVAEVSLSIINDRRTAPAAFNHFEELEVCRRIERGSGSGYKINGKAVRMRDLQILFADNATGANSPALVSQGKVSMVINAKPIHRRMLLEEAAGIAGLRQRRHEAELKLNAASDNLERLEDVIITMDTQMGGLKKQARQANRYRNISVELRKAEAILLLLKWLEAEDERKNAKSDFKAAEEVNRSSMIETARETKLQAEQAAILPELRNSESALAAALQRLIIARETLDQDKRRVLNATEKAEIRLQEVTRDRARELSLEEDAKKALDGLEEELLALKGETSDAGDSIEIAEVEIQEQQKDIEALEAGISALTLELAASKAERVQSLGRLSEAERQEERVSGRLSAATARLADISGKIEVLPSLDEAESLVELAEKELEAARRNCDLAEAKQDEAEAVRRAARAEEQAAKNKAAALVAEISGLERMLASGQMGDFTPLIDEITVLPGYETALAALLSEDIRSSLDEDAPIFWRELSDLPEVEDLPAGISHLGDMVSAPRALQRFISSVGLVSGDEPLPNMVEELKAGQILVSKKGAVWRWDGRVQKAGAPNAGAIRLEQRNRLGKLQNEEEEAARLLELQEQRMESSSLVASEAKKSARIAREDMNKAYENLNQSRNKAAEYARSQASLLSQKEAEAAGLERLREDLEQAGAVLEEAKIAVERLPEEDNRQGDLVEEQNKLAVARQGYNEKRRDIERLRAAEMARDSRLVAIGREEINWKERVSGAGERVSEYNERIAESRAEIARLVEKPEQIDADVKNLMTEIEVAEQKRNFAADELSRAENLLIETERRLAAANVRLADGREAKARAESRVENALVQSRDYAERLHEKMECSPEEVLAKVDFDEDEELPDSNWLNDRIAKLKRERDNIGAVNLRAEKEIEELNSEIEIINNEREDLFEAIAKLRQAINRLNGEARERLLAAFEEVDTHFRTLFSRLYGGGEAHLRLTEADDPLEAGLEIYASPPGKKLQHLSLLSGGEQALTALSLLFAVFRTVPSPICVLDEVDAPLDEANVDRLCSLLKEIADKNATRFILISHHRLTMARMNRLFGVTMGEKGVSQLVSVNLSEAEDMHDAA